MSSSNAESAAQRLHNDLLGEALDQWEAEDAPFDDDELAAAGEGLRQSGQLHTTSPTTSVVGRRAL